MGKSVVKREVSHRDLMALAFLGLLSPAIRAVSAVEPDTCGKALWLSPLVTAAVILPVYCVIRRLRRGKSENLGQLLRLVWGRKLGGAMCVLVAVWILFYTGLVLRAAGERLVSCVYNDSDWLPFSAVILALSAWAAAKPVKNLIRTARALLPLVIGALVPVFLFLISDIRPENLLPVSITDAGGIAAGSLHMTSVTSMFGFFWFLDRGESSRSGASCILGLVLFMTAVSLAVVGVLSAGVAAGMSNPFFIVMRNITFFNVLERVEAIIVGLWVISDFLFVSAMLSICCNAVGLPEGERGRPVMAAGLAIGALGAAILTGGSAFELTELADKAAPAGNMFLTLVLIPVTVIGAAIRKV